MTGTEITGCRRGKRDYNYSIHCCYVMGYSALRRAAASAPLMYVPLPVEAKTH